jgi:hypothetical protein
MGMVRTRRDLLLWLGALGLAPATARAGASELVVVVHPGVARSVLDELELEAIFTTSKRFWSGSQSIVPFNLPPRGDERVSFDHAVLRMDPDDVGRFWLDRRVRGGPPPPRQAPDPLTVVRLVARLEGAIGYAPVGLPLADVRVVARIREGKVVRP